MNIMRLKYCKIGHFRIRENVQISVTGNSSAGNFREFLVRGASYSCAGNFCELTGIRENFLHAKVCCSTVCA